MNIIIDTHIFLWALSDPNKINAAKRQALEDLSNTIYVSAVSIAELMIKASVKKLQIDFDPVEVAKKAVSPYLILAQKRHYCSRICPFIIKILSTACSSRKALQTTIQL